VGGARRAQRIRLYNNTGVSNRIPCSSSTRNNAASGHLVPERPAFQLMRVQVPGAWNVALCRLLPEIAGHFEQPPVDRGRGIDCFASQQRGQPLRRHQLLPARDAAGQHRSACSGSLFEVGSPRHSDVAILSGGRGAARKDGTSLRRFDAPAGRDRRNRAMGSQLIGIGGRLSQPVAAP
jgi:hypothetical protein